MEDTTVVPIFSNGRLLNEEKTEYFYKHLRRTFYFVMTALEIKAVLEDILGFQEINAQRNKTSLENFDCQQLLGELKYICNL